MILEVVQSKWSLTWYDPLGPRMCVLELMNGDVLQTLREQLKVPGSRLEGSELLTSDFLRFRSRLNETSGGLGENWCCFRIGLLNFKSSEDYVSGG